MSKTKGKDKKKKRSKGKSNLGVYKFMKSSLDLHGCWINQDWQTAGSAYIVVARKMNSGLFVFACFLVNTTQDRLDHCFGDANITEEKLRRDLLEKNSNISFFKVDIELVKDLLAKVYKNKAQNFPEHFNHLLHLVGNLEENLDKLQNQEISSFEHQASVDYSVRDLEEIEAELIQVPNIEETENSRIGHKEYYWLEPSRDKTPQPKARIIITEEGLKMEIKDAAQRDKLDLSLCQYLGTAIEPKGK